jgi:hypothetical protein
MARGNKRPPWRKVTARAGKQPGRVGGQIRPEKRTRAVQLYSIRYFAMPIHADAAPSGRLMSFEPPPATIDHHLP